MKYLVLLMLCSPVFAQTLQDQFPEAPQPVKHSKYGGYEVDKDKLPKHEPLFTKTWVGVHLFYLSTIAADAEATHQGLAHHRCQEGNISLGARPSRGGLYKESAKEAIPIIALDLLFQAVWRADKSPKAFQWVPMIGAGYGSGVHLKGAIDWYSKCY